MKLPRVAIAAPASGGGKTSLTLGLLGALEARGLDVRAFKVGPDYIDPALHSAVLGKPSRNLDLRLMGGEATLASLARNGGGGGISVIEGVMGLFDGSNEGSSTADIAVLTGTPVIVVIDAYASAESAGALALGFASYRRDLKVAGFILNRVAGKAHCDAAAGAIRAATGLPVLGFLPNSPRLSLPERHLGLELPGDSADFRAVVAELAAEVEAKVDLDAIVAIANGAPEPRPAGVGEENRAAPASCGGAPVEIAVARDAAFSFYYEDNFDAMRDIGLEPVFFSPLADRCLPAGASGLYLGGGYPELNAERLARNDAMRDSIRRAAAAGLPVFAECGGYLYLLESLEDMEGRAWPGCAVLPGRAVMGKGLAGLGYREARTEKDGVLGPAGTALVGHVFHYSRVEGARGDLAMRQARGGHEELDGSISGSVFGSYLHLHFAGNRGALANFAAACSAYRAIALSDAKAEGAFEP